MKRMIFVLVIIFISQWIKPLCAQISDDQKNNISSYVKKEIIKQNQISKKSENDDNFQQGRSISNAISTAIRKNELSLAMQYFDYYAKILDTLVVTNPIVAKKILFDLSEIYIKVKDTEDKILFYQGATYYYLNSYKEAESSLKSLIKSYPRSPMLSQALTLLIKTCLYTSQEKQAIALIEANKENLLEEQKYLAGHAYFVLEKDSLASYYFTQVVDGKYAEDAERMLFLLSALKLEPQAGIDELLKIVKIQPDNPFLVLALARLYSVNGQWKNAEIYYTKYFANLKSYREIQAQYERALLYINLGDKSKAVDILNNTIKNNELGSDLGSFLFQWSEINASDGQSSSAFQRISQIKEQIDSNKQKIQSKLDLIYRIGALKSDFGKNPSISAVNTTVSRLGMIITELDSLNAQLERSPYGMSKMNLDLWQIYERQIIISVSEQLHYYLIADNIKEQKDTLHINQIEALETIYRDQTDRITKIRESVIRLNDQNLLLAIRNEIDNNLDILDKTLSNLYEMKKSGRSKYSPAQLDTLIASNERKKVETSLLLDYYDFDNSLYKLILAECDSSLIAIQSLLKGTPALKDDFQKKYQPYLSRKEKDLVVEVINKPDLFTPEYVTSITNQKTLFDKIQKEIEFIDLYTAFIETCYYDNVKKQQEATLTFEDNQRLFAENQIRKQQVYDKMQRFVNEFPSFLTDKVPASNLEINVKAHSYFALAELSNSLWQDRPGNSLEYYWKVLEADPNFYQLDAVLYNIGYVSSILVKDRIEDGISVFESRYSSAISRPDSLRFTEITYSEPIKAYKRIINEYKESKYYSEALFRLGYIYFEIGTNADRPIEYYQIARSYYDKLINDPEDPYRYKALYQRGWTWLNSSSEEAYYNAMDDFITILKAINNKQIADSTEAIDYSLASLKNIGYCLIGLDGADINASSKGAAYAKTTLANLLNEKDRNLVLDEAIVQKLKLFMPMQAIDYLRAKIELEPLALENPVIADSICILYKTYASQIMKDTSPDSIYIAEREALMRNYGLNSVWFKANKDKQISNQLQIIKQTYDFIEGHYNNQFVDNPNQANFDKYIALIGQYQEFSAIHDEQQAKWIETKQANIIAMNIKLAQVTKNLVDLISAAKRIYLYNDTYLDNSTYFNLEGTAYDCARIINDSLRINAGVAKYFENKITLPLSATNIYSYIDLAAERFVSVLLSPKYRSPENDNLYITVIMRQAEIAREQKRYTQSSEFYQKLISFDGNVSNVIKRSVYINLAEIADSTKNYIDAEKWYKNAENYALNKSDKESLHLYAMIQIQNSVDYALDNGNNNQAGEEYLRLSKEYSDVDPTKSLQYKAKAQVSYLAAKEYQKSINLLLDMAKSKKTPSEVLDFYRFAWSIADSISYGNQADSIKLAFIDLYPSSNQAYQLRLTMIDKKASNPATMIQAGEMYMTLYNDVISKKIDNGKDNPIDLYLAAIGLYDQGGDEKTKETLAEQFVSKYPNHSSTVKLLEYLADKQLAKGDSASYEQMAKTIFQKDKSSQSRYTNLAKEKLRKIASEFNAAYIEKNWQLAFNRRDEFKKVQTGYEKEGLVLDFAPVYEAFKQAEKEYGAIQDRLAFLRQFDMQLNQIENGFIKRSPDELLRVNVNTKWKTNLIEGKENRIQALKNMANSETKKVKQILDSGVKYDIDVDRRLRAVELICKIYEHSSDVVKIQIDKYMKTTTEFKSFQEQYRGYEDELYSTFNAQRDGHSFSLIQQAYPYYLVMYKNFYIPGYHNKYTNNVYKKLAALNAVPRFRIDELYPDKSWQISLIDMNDTTKVKKYDGKIDSITSPKGMRFAQLAIPANHEMVLEKRLETKVPYDYAIANAITPYYNDSMFEINGATVDYAFNPIDTLKAGEIATTRYAMTFGENEFISGKNDIALHYFNFDTLPMNLSLNIMVISDSVEIEAAMPIDTTFVNTNESWEYAVMKNNQSSLDWKKSVKVENYGFNKSQWYEMENSKADPIWVNTKDGSDSLMVVFRKEINLNGLFKDGVIKFIAPDIATVKLNDQELSTDYQLNYDSESNLVFAGQLALTSSMLKQGKNTLQIFVSNKSQWKGIVAEVSLIVAHPE